VSLLTCGCWSAPLDLLKIWRSFQLLDFWKLHRYAPLSQMLEEAGVGRLDHWVFIWVTKPSWPYERQRSAMVQIMSIQISSTLLNSTPEIRILKQIEFNIPSQCSIIFVDNVILQHNSQSYSTRLRCMLRVTHQVAAPVAKFDVYDCTVYLFNNS